MCRALGPSLTSCSAAAAASGCWRATTTSRSITSSVALCRHGRAIAGARTLARAWSAVRGSVARRGWTEAPETRRVQWHGNWD